MIIDRNARVVPPRYTGKEQRALMGWAIGHADRDAMLAILVWSAECRAVRDIRDGWKAHAERVQREMDEAETRSRRGRWSLGPGSVARRSAATAAAAFKDSLEPELEEARAASSECVALYEAISSRVGKSRKLGKASHREAENSGPLWQFLQQAEERLAALLDEDRQRLHTLALWEQSRIAGDSSDVAILDALDDGERDDFVRMVRDLLEAEGNSLSPSDSRAPRMDLFQTPSGCTVGVRVMHHRIKRGDVSRGWVWFSSVPQQAHRDGIAAAADAVVLITNIEYNHMARRFAKAHGIILLGRAEVRKWIEWGVTLDLDTCVSKREVG
ncbi:hypothetical protein AB0C93_11900 [Streptomyces sp. NPDC048518]|uniref:hypothetical protein n=1 Tax=Streptomyces sp. NPDC048518 TaxID=3155029 RepID=UPI0033D04DDA